MKKVVLVICAGILLTSGLSSCEKAYTCECINHNGVRSTSEVIATGRTEAQKDCDELGLKGHCEVK